MPVAVGPYGQSQPSCFDRVKMGFVMGCAVGWFCLSAHGSAYGGGKVSLKVLRDLSQPNYRYTTTAITMKMT